MKKRKYTRPQIYNLLDLVERFLRLEELCRRRKLPTSPAAQRMEHRKMRLEQWLKAEERVNAESRRPTEAVWDETYFV